MNFSVKPQKPSRLGFPRIYYTKIGYSSDTRDLKNWQLKRTHFARALIEITDTKIIHETFFFQTVWCLSFTCRLTIFLRFCIKTKIERTPYKNFLKTTTLVTFKRCTELPKNSEKCFVGEVRKIISELRQS